MSLFFKYLQISLHYTLTLLFVISYSVNFHSQNSFSGELTYRITKINANELQAGFPNNDIPAEEKMIIYAKDSLLKIVHFNSVNGIQESLQHLRLQKKILLITVDSIQYAIQLPKESASVGGDTSYHLKKKCFPRRRIGGVKGKPMALTHTMLKNSLQIWYAPKIESSYNAPYPEIPGLALRYYIVSEKGLFLYELENFKRYEPPLALFKVPKDATVLPLHEFLEILKDTE